MIQTFATSPLRLSLQIELKPIISLKTIHYISFSISSNFSSFMSYRMFLSLENISFYVLSESHHASQLFISLRAGDLYFCASSTISSQYVLDHASFLTLCVSPAPTRVSSVIFSPLLDQDFYSKATCTSKTYKTVYSSSFPSTTDIKRQLFQSMAY